MEQLQNRHDLTDAQWNRIEPIIKQHLNKRGGSNANDNRVFVNGLPMDCKNRFSLERSPPSIRQVQCGPS